MTFPFCDSLKKAGLAWVGAAWKPIEYSRLSREEKPLQVQSIQEAASQLVPRLRAASREEDGSSAMAVRPPPETAIGRVNSTPKPH